MADTVYNINNGVNPNYNHKAVTRNKFPIIPNEAAGLTKEAWDKAMQAINYPLTVAMPQPLPKPLTPKIVSPYVDWDKKTYVLERYDHDMEVTILMGVFTNKDEAEKFAKTKMYGEYEVYEFTIDQEVVVDEPKE